jgi:hypothetical protein
MESGHLICRDCLNLWSDPEQTHRVTFPQIFYGEKYQRKLLTDLIAAMRGHNAK